MITAYEFDGIHKMIIFKYLMYIICLMVRK